MHLGLSWRHERLVWTRACGWSWMEEGVCLMFGMLAHVSVALFYLDTIDTRGSLGPDPFTCVRKRSEMCESGACNLIEIF